MLQSLRHRRQSAADGRQKQGIEPLITEPADHRNQASGEFYFGTFGESSNGVDTCLFTKRLERGRFVWPAAKEGKISLSPSQLSMLLEGIDWRTPQKTWRPLVTG